MLCFKNVNDAFSYVCDYAADLLEIEDETRNGPVLRTDGPIMWRFSYPIQRVLFNRARHANPFFHIYEAMWMLAGHNNVAPLVHYNSKMLDFSDDGFTLHDAYGHRWRATFGMDQLDDLVHILQDRSCRRAVLGMWDVHKDLTRVRFQPECKAVPCNTHIYFEANDYALNMTVCNRSNDLVWGALGANAVHFSFLQEYMAARLGLHVGYMYTMSNNLHVYKWNWNPQKWFEDDTINVYENVDAPTLLPLAHATEVAMLDDDIRAFVECPVAPSRNTFLNNVAVPMMDVFQYHKERDYDAAEARLDDIVADDWQFACRNWIAKVRKNWETDDK